MSEADLFAAALKLTDPAARAAFLDQACAGNPALRISLEQLLRAHEQPHPRLDAPSASRSAAEPQALMASTIVPPVDTPPQQIGPYRILERIGGGGMGEVFRAEQRSPIRREVALKFIKLGMDTKAVIARFEAERQALALMDHPHIARVLDAGTDDAGRPYFVMEYVKGKPITDYADKQQLTIAERLELVEQVCQAIQHAHHKGVIHRDLKPSNILVSTQDGKPFAKVIDFGIAKAIGQQLTDKTLFTLHDQFVGTPQYMSPEQAEGSLDIDTRTDVYSLGVLLYELLTGTPPFSAKELRLAAWDQFRKQIIEVDPPKPSTRLSESGSDLATLATSRRTEPKRLGTLVRGDLDWIVMKALEKDRKRRYETPSSLAGDLQAHLCNQPILAAPPSTIYRLGKFVRRYRGSVLAAGLLMITLLMGLTGTSYGLLRAINAEKRSSELLGDLNQQIDETETELKRILPQSLLDQAQYVGYEDLYDDPRTPPDFTVGQLWPIRRDDGTLVGYTKANFGKHGLIGDVEVLNADEQSPSGLEYVRILGQFAADRSSKWRDQIIESQSARDSAERNLALGLLRPMASAWEPSSPEGGDEGVMTVPEIHAYLDWCAITDHRLRLRVLEVAFEKPETALRVAVRARWVVHRGRNQPHAAERTAGLAHRPANLPAERSPTANCRRADFAVHAADECSRV